MHPLKSCEKITIFNAPKIKEEKCMSIFEKGQYCTGVDLSRVPNKSKIARVRVR